MNKIYKVVWSKVKNSYVVVSEVAKANGKSGVRSIAAAAAVAVMMSGGTALAADVTYADFVAAADGKVISVTEDTTVTGENGNSLAGYTLNVGDGVDLTVNEIKGVKNVTGNGNVEMNITSNSTALANGGTINVNNLTVNVDDKDSNTRSDSATKWGSTTIKATEDVSFVTGDHAVHTEGGTVTIEARNITMESGQRAIINSYNGNVILKASGDVDLNASVYNFPGSRDNGTIQIDANNITIDSGHDGVMNGADGIVRLTAKNDLTIKAGEGRKAVWLLESSTAEGTGDILLQADGKTVIEGNVINEGLGDIDASFDGEGSYLKGAAVNSGDGGIDLTFDDGAVWDVTGDSTITGLGGTDGVIQKAETAADDVALDVVGNDDRNALIKDSTLEFKGVDLTLTNDCVKGDINEGVIYNTTIVSDGKVTLEQTGTSNPVLGTGTNMVEAVEVEINAAADKAVTGYGVNTVTANKITVNAPVDGIFVPNDSGDGKVVMNGFDEMTINAGEHAIVNNASNAADTTISIEGNENSVLNLNSDGERPTIAVKTGANKTEISAGAVNINGNADNKYGAVVYAADGADIAITATNTDAETGGINIVNEGTGGAAVLAKAADEETTITLGGNIDIDANGGRGVNAKNGTAVDVAGTAVINVGDETTTAININDASYGLIAQYNGTEINVKGDALNIDGGGSGNGIWAMNGNLTDTEPADNAKITVDKDTVTTIENVDSAIVATSQGTVDIAGDLYATANNEVIGARGGSTININSAGDQDTIVQLKGDIIYELSEKDVHAVDATVNVNLMNSDSWLEGNIYKNQVAVDAGSPTGDVTGMSLGLANGAHWTTEGSAGSFVNNLTMDGGIINQKSTGEITIDNLTGEGNVVFAEGSGQVNVLAAEAGAKLNLSMAGVDADSFNTTKDLNGLAKMIDVAEDATSNVTGNIHVDEGLINGAIDMTVDYEDVDDDELLNGVVKDVRQGTSTTVASASGVAANTAVAWREEDATLSQRLGELRGSKDGQGVWARFVQGEFERGNDFETEYNMFQIGYDKAKDDWHYGVAVNHTEGDTVYAAGSGELSNTSVLAYGTWLGERGHYKDIVAKVGSISSDYSINAAGQLTKGEYDTYGTSLSAEYGMKNDMGKGWFVTPLAKMTYMHIGADSYTTNNGINVKHDAIDSLVARLGVEFGKELGKKGAVYVKASALHDFCGDADTTLRLDGNSALFTDEIGGTWYEVGFGLNYKMSDATNLYADVIKVYGDEIRTPWQWNAGVRYSF